METNNDFNFNLFRPTSEFGKKHRNIILSMIIIWAVAVFGFQILLRIIQKPTPEKALITYESVIDKVKSGNSTLDEKKSFIYSLISVLGKSTVKSEYKVVLSDALSWAVFDIVDSNNKAVLSNNILELKSYHEKLTKSTTDVGYLETKSVQDNKRTEIINQLSTVTGIKTGSLESDIMVYNLNSEAKKSLNEDEIFYLSGIMKLYLTHNQSFLTDTKFLGFPFHYFYTAEFLLILFVLLCLIYSYRIEKLYKKFSIQED